MYDVLNADEKVEKLIGNYLPKSTEQIIQLK